jgi:hypothetical protein
MPWGSPINCSRVRLKRGVPVKTTNASQVHSKNLQVLREEIRRKTGKTPEQLFEEREKRVRDAIELKEPDRIPLWLIAEPNSRLGLPSSAAYYDPVAWKEAIIKEILDFEPDLYIALFGASGRSWEVLEVKNKLWPGGPLPPDYGYQFVEGEYMKANEYDLFLSDPSDFIVRYYLPRVYNALVPLSKLPPIGLMYNSFEFITNLFSSPEFRQMAKALAKAGEELEKHQAALGDAHEELASLGFPELGHPGGVGGAPFDVVSSSLRGMKGSMLDMYRQPEKLLQACELLLNKRISAANPADPNLRGNPKRVGVPLWRGDVNFMSDEQFERFYWPGLKKALLATIELGYVPIPLFEAKFGKRLERLLELPKGKVAAVVENVDIIQAREILGGHVCVIGKPPVSLQYASIQETKDYYKNLFKACGKGGGFMTRLILPNKATIEELKEMVKSIKEYARY